MKALDKSQYVKEARKILSELDVDTLANDANNLTLISKINRLIAIFTNFSSNDGKELTKRLQELQKWFRRSTSKGTIRNRAVDVLQFVGQKIEEMDIYVIEPDEKSFFSILNKLRNVQRLIKEGLAYDDEKKQILQEVREHSKLFKDDIYKRKAEKLSKQTIWSKQTRDGFVAADEYDQLTPWVELIEDYLGEDKLLISEKVIEDMTPYEGRKFLRSILEKANNEIVVVDNFLSHEVLFVIEPYVLKGINFKLLTRRLNNNKFRSFATDYKTFKNQYRDQVEAKENSSCHDRFVIVDGHMIYHFGASLAELGNTLSVANLIEGKIEKNKLFTKFTSWWTTGTTL
jgi:hypothetical protein